jgi:hypothetical protein
MYQVSIYNVRSDALFASPLQPSNDPNSDQVRLAVTEAVRRYRSRGCAAVVAQEFGDHPEAAVERMRWSHRIVDAVFGGTPLTVDHRPVSAASRVAQHASAA